MLSGRCNNCSNGYYPAGPICVFCGINCLNCFNTTHCSACLPGWKLTSGSCTTCDVGFFGSTSQCLVCPNNCKNCTNSTNCIQCMDGYSFYNNNICCSHGTSICNPDGSSYSCKLNFNFISPQCICDTSKNMNLSLTNDTCDCLPPLTVVFVNLVIMILWILEYVNRSVGTGWEFLMNVMMEIWMLWMGVVLFVKFRMDFLVILVFNLHIVGHW